VRGDASEFFQSQGLLACVSSMSKNLQKNLRTQLSFKPQFQTADYKMQKASKAGYDHKHSNKQQMQIWCPEEDSNLHDSHR
jgi:hypothetical protein